jgi:UDP-glucose:(heptosyl)LPS alpha-1,3-glucosyltransferase
MKKKIALLLFNYFPFGGLQKDFYAIATELKNRGFEIKIFTGSWDGDNPEAFEVVELGISGITNHKRNINFFNKVKKELETYDPDLVFGFNKMPGLDLYFAADTCFKYKVRTTKPAWCRLTQRYKKSLKFEDAVFNKDSKTKILILNEKQRKEFSHEYQTQEERLLTVPPGISKDWSSSEISDIRKDYQLPTESNLLLFVGSDFRRKGLDRAIKSVKFLQEKTPNSFLLVAGQGKEAKFRKQAFNLGLHDKVLFLGPVDNISNLMAQSSALLHPAREEAAGNVIIEAIISSLPVITCDTVGFASFIKKYNAGCVLEGNFDQNLFNKLLEEFISGDIDSTKSGMEDLKDDDYFYSRFRFIGDSVEAYFNE